MSYPSMDAYQQTVGLSFLANRAAGYTGSQQELQQQLQYDLSFYIQDVPPVTGMTAPGQLMDTPLQSWSLQFGPLLMEHVDTNNNQPSGVADNALYVAYCDSVNFPGAPAPMPAYVVAIAATNFISEYDWVVEDFTVSKVVDWNTYDPTNIVTTTPDILKPAEPFISLGTATGVSNLLAMANPAGAAGTAGDNLQAFLATLKPAEPTAIIFTGHSLAGALSPTLAFYLQNQGALSAFSVVLTYPTAGATPGNWAPVGSGGFVGAFNSAFPAVPAGWTAPAGPLPYQHWNTDLWNVYDVVPHAWNLLSLGLIANLYGTSSNQTVAKQLQALQDAAIANSTASGVLYTRIRNQPLPGSLQDSRYTDQNGTTGSVAVNVPPQSLEDFVAQLLIQHVYMYEGIIGDDSLTPAVQTVQGLILQQPLPKPVFTPPATGLVSGVKQLTTDQVIDNMVAWLTSHLAVAAVADMAVGAE